MKNKVARIFLAALLTTSMVMPGAVNVFAEEAAEQENASDEETAGGEQADAGEVETEVTEDGMVIQYFQNPDNDSKPMARMWFPDAGAGVDDNDVIEKQIQELADKGFGGVEVAMLADGVSYNNEEGREYGWGTENWSKLLKKVLKAAAKVEGGFQVDATISAHWPPAFNTIDPNDDGASKELSYSVTKLTAGEDGSLDITLPEQKISGPVNGFTGQCAYPGFLFTDTFIAAAKVQVSGIETTEDEEGNETSTYVFDYSTLTPVTDNVSADHDGGYAAGVPDKDAADKYGWNYDEICEAFGPEPEGELVNNNGKADANYNRARMADWQDAYKLDTSELEVPESSDGDEIQPGDWVVLSSFYRGTGQAIPGGRIMHNTVFVTSYYNEVGTSTVTDYWNKMFEEDPELKELMEANPGYIFEDSIESSSTTSYWAAGLQDDASDLEYGDILSLVAASRYTGSGFGGSTLTEFFKFDNDDGLSDRIYEDYNTLLADSYVKYRVSGVTNWAHDTIGWGFRGQTYQLPGLEISKAASVADVPECDNMSKGDGVRYQAGTYNVNDKDYLTMEAITGPTIEYTTMDDVITELGQNYSDGVNRAILHGTPYAKTFNGYNSQWPGWLPFGVGSFGSAYTYRAAYWDDIDTETSYMSRIQAVLQKGTAQIDLAVLIDKESTFDFESGNRFQNLLDSGYSYNLISEAILESDNAYVEDGKLAPEGPAFKALILDRVNTFDVENMEKVIEYAKNGLPVIVYDSTFSKVYGSNVEDDAILAEKFAELLEMDNVIQANSVEDVKQALADVNVTPYAQYETAQLETTMYTDKADGSNYYYMYNNAYPENSGMMGNDQASEYKGEEKAIKDAVITLAGTGVPYKLDTHTGEITQVGAYTVNDDGTVTFEMDELYGGDSVIYCVTEDTENFPAESVYVTEADGDVVRTEEGVALRSNEAGNYTFTLSDGTEASADVEKTLDTLDLTDASWNLLIHSYGPGEDENDPSVSKITDVDFGEQKLGKWKDIAATEDQLNELGVTDMLYVSGVGEYTTTFTLPEDWSDTTGAYLDVTYGKDQIGEITINGTALDANNASDRVDLGGYLVSGENILTIKLSTTLYARMYATNSGYEGRDFGMGTGFMQPEDPEAFYDGLLSVTLTPYTQVTIQ